MSTSSQPTTLADVLLSAANGAPGSRLVTVHRDGSESAIDYPQLAGRALSLLAVLQAQGVRDGQRLIIQLGAPARQIEAFWACVLGGIVPVLLPKVGSWRRDSEPARRLRTVCHLYAEACLLVDRDQQADYAAGLSGLGGVRWLVDDDTAAATAPASVRRTHPEDPAYLQFSSGSTGVPKGVRLTHANIMANLRDLAQAYQLQPEHGFLNWMPYYHDMGLVMFHLLPTYLGASQVKLDAADFIADPLLWLAKIHQHRSAVVGGPNFGLRHVLEKLGGAGPEGVDLSCVHAWINGAEPIWVPTLHTFSARLAAVGLRREALLPGYGLAEATVAVSLTPLGSSALVHRLDRQALLREGLVRDAGANTEVIEYADLGVPLPSTQVRIAGEDGQDLGEGRLGEIQIRGASVTAGYETASESANRDLFHATGWLRTGDLGFLRNGRLTVTGRIKDVIFINGRNVMAADVEQHLSERFGIKAGRIAACGVTEPAGGTEAVAVFVVARTRNADWALLHEIRAAAEDYLGHPVDSVLPVRRIPHTSSGKLQRYQLARQWHLGEFAPLAAEFRAHRPRAESDAVVREDLEQLVRDAWIEVLHLKPADVGLSASFTSLGGTSVRAIEMLALIEDRLGRRFGTKLLLECRTVRDIVAYIASARSSAIPASGTVPAPHQPVPIAIVGMAGRFPGAVSLEHFWRNLRDGVSSIREVPPGRWGDSGPRFHMGCLDGVDLFAADFFGIADDEAAVMDPQQRLMLEVAYEALDDAGYTGARMPADRNVGVYVGASYNAYLEQIVERRRQGGFVGSNHAQLLPANLLNMIAARVAQALDLKGPALSFDTACSSSLVALHYACSDLAAGQCDVALAGGVNLLPTPTVLELLDQAGALSREGVCRAFDKAASGMVPGEGMGLVVLKRLDRAVADGDRIDAVVAATAINNDGRSIGIMAPTPEGQEAVVRQALAKAGVPPGRISYVEAHGTGTPIGDPVEVGALTAAYGAPADGPYCGIGSVKTNIGHLLAAAGIAGLIKLVLSLRHGLLPPTLNLETPHPRLRFECTPLRPVLAPTPWPRGESARHAGISSFGFGGTNAHVIVRDPEPLLRPAGMLPRTYHLVCWSARNREELLAVRARLLDHLLQHPESPLLDLSYTSCAGRAGFKLREFIVTGSVQDAIVQLQQGHGDAGAASSQAAGLYALGDRWRRGEAIDWATHFAGAARIAPLPLYPFTRRQYWLPLAAAAVASGVPPARERDWDTPGRPPADWHYTLEWVQGPEPEAIEVDATHRVVFGAETAVGAAFCRALAAQGHRFTRVSAGVSCAPLGADAYMIDEGRAGDYAVLLDALAERHGGLAVCDLRACRRVADGGAMELATLADATLAGALRLAQAVLARSDTVKRLLIGTANAMPVRGGAEEVSPVGAALWSFTRSLALETPALELRCVDVDLAGDVGAAAEQLLAESFRVDAPRFRAWRDAVSWLPSVRQAAGSPPTAAFTADQTYLIAGGLGGIGLALARWLAVRGRPTLILLARALHPHRLEQVAQLRALGATVHLVQADITDPQAMARAASEIAALCPRLDRVIHAAGVLRDRRVAEMSLEELQDVLRAKAAGTALLYEHTRALQPTRFVLFSSLVSVVGHAGQANHAAANGFQDGFAAWLRRRGEESLVINWGLWGEDGVVAEPRYIASLARERIHPMRTEAALAALARAWVGDGGRAIIANVGVGFFGELEPDPALGDLVARCAGAAVGHGDDRVQLAFDRLCAALIDAVFEQTGAFGAATWTSVDELCGGLQVRPDRRAHLRRLLDVAVQAGYFQADGDRYQRLTAAQRPDVDALARDIVAEFPFAGGAVQLVQRCMRALPAVWAGQRQAVEVLFSGGSVGELEAFYEQFPALARANAMVAAVCQGIVDRHPGRAPAVLEVGAGTGALTAAAVPVLRTVVSDYAYTDVSRRFLAHGQARFGDWQRLRTALFDLEREPAPQGLAAASFDLIVGANVLHATADVRRAVRHLREVLRPGGQLVLVETVRPNVFADCTVGLLDGWWGFRDRELRSDYPLLDAHQWQDLLREEGFRAAVVSADTTRGIHSGTAVIIATDQRTPAAMPAPARTEAHAKVAAGAPSPRYQGAPPAGGSAVDYVAKVIEADLAAQDITVTDRAAAFSALGADSMVAVQTCNTLQAKLGVEVPLSLFFEFGSVERLACHLAEEHGERISQLLRKVGRGTGERPAAPSLQPIAMADHYELSHAQRRLWFLAQLEPGNPFYNIPGAIAFDGDVDADAFEAGLRHVVATHEALRTRFVEIDGEPRQCVDAAVHVRVRRVDLTPLPEDARAEALARLRAAESTDPFDLTACPLLRATLVRMTPASHVFIYVLHHIIADGWSLRVLVQQLAAAYNALRRGDSPQPLPLPVQYKDYAAWQNALLREGCLAGQERYWLSQLSGDMPILQLPTDLPRPAMQTYRGAVTHLTLDRALADGLAHLAASCDATMFMVLLTGLATLFHRLTHQQDLIIGSPIAGRTSDKLSPLVGFFVNALALRLDVSGQPTVDELLRRARHVTTDAFANQDFPFDRLVELLNPVRDLARAPIFTVMLVYQAAKVEASLRQVFDGAKVQPLPNDWMTAKFDLQLFVKETDAGLAIALEYNTDLLFEASAQRLLAQLRNLLEGMVARPEARLSELPLLSAEQRQQMLVGWNDVPGVDGAGRTLHECVSAQCALTPDALAVVDGARELTYRDLDRAAIALAHTLRGLGVRPEVLVGVFAPRSLETVVALLAILKAGGAYVPLDPAYPADRIGMMVDDCGASLVLTTAALAAHFPRPGLRTLLIDDAARPQPDQGDAPLPATAAPENAAYLIYTSGSTGRPKAVVIRHSSAVVLVEWARRAFSPEELAGTLASTSICFDLSVFEMFVPISVGGSVIVVGNVLDLPRYDGRRPVSLVNTVPSAARALVQAGGLPASVLTVNLAGEPFTEDLVHELYDCAHVRRVVNLYGPSEDTTYSTVKVLNRDAKVTLGRPIANTEVYILDGALQPVAVGVVGEVYIGGDGLGRGYFKRPGITAERFLPHPFARAPGRRIYRTGDLGRFRDDGEIEYAGRVDHQVKIRGFRIELGEIEAGLRDHPLIREAAVIARDDGGGGKRLIAYVRTDEDTLASTALPEEGARQVEQWRTVFDDTYAHSSAARDPDFNIAGWTSRYDGANLAEADMREWVASTVARLRTLNTRRVLELGCGTGLLLFRLMADCERYTATDFSRATLDYLRDNLHVLGSKAACVELLERNADDIRDLPTAGYDLVILNSVAQYFPSFEYLLRVIEAVLDRLAPGGSLFLGDLRSLPLLPTFAASLALHGAASNLALGAVRNAALHQAALDSELVVDPALFPRLQRHIPGIGHVRVLPKRAGRHNELSKYRYDVVIQRDAVECTPLAWERWGQNGLDSRALEQRLARGGDVLAVTGVPNARLARDVLAAERLAEPGALQTVGELRRVLAQAPGGVDPQELERQAERHGYRVELSWIDGAADGSYRAVFARQDRTMPAFTVNPDPRRELAEYASSPAQALLRRSLGPRLRQHLCERLPEHMVPGAFVWLPRLPLTPNGKLDRNALPDPQCPGAAQEFVAPRTVAERNLCRIWTEVLGQDRIGVHDDFFELGGHSLLATQVVSRINQALGTAFALRVVFEARTVARLAALLPADAPSANNLAPRVSAIARRARVAGAPERLKAVVDANRSSGA